MRRAWLCAAWVGAVAVGACGRSYLPLDVSGGRDGGATDGALGMDARVPDGGRRDAGRDASEVDAPALPDASGCRTNAECNDGRFCDGLERCQAGRCVEAEVPPCNDGVACTRDSCDETRDECSNLADSTLCGASQICDPAMGCTSRPCRSNSDCNDRDACNGAERCVEGFCRGGTPVICNDGVACTVDRCESPSGLCVHEPDDSSCDDGAFCNGAERCVVDVGCRPSMPPACSDGVACTVDVCDEMSDRCVSTRPDVDRDGIAAASCGGTDCDDMNPLIRPGVPEVCSDSVDNNCNGQVDCAEPSCASRPVCRPDGGMCAALEICGNGIDDDCNMRVDCADMRCVSRPECMPRDGGMCAPRELGVAACTNGRDDDCDARTDCSDPDCSPFGPGGECCDGADNDGDGTTDVFTCRCFSDADCVGVGSLEQICWESTFSVCGPRCNFSGGDLFCSMFFGPETRCDSVSGECVPR